jgi:cytochrome c-type biogenesis protein CcmH/NrfG
MRFSKCLLLCGFAVWCGQAFAQVGQNWSKERNVLPPGYGASEAKVVILSDGSINVTFRGGESVDPQVGGISYTRSTNQGYSWMKPRAAVIASGIIPVTHELLSDGDNLLLFVGLNRLARFEVQQFISVNHGQSWQESDVVFSNSDPVKGLLAWRLDGRMFVMVLTERTRPGGLSEFTYWLARGRASGAYWEEPTKVHNFFASQVSPPQLMPSERWPTISWKVDGIDFHLLQTGGDDGLTWRDYPVSTLPSVKGSALYDRGIYYKVQATKGRQLLFNRTDDEAPTTPTLSNVPRELDKPNLKLTWQSKDNYTLPSALKYELRLDEGAPILIKDATTYEFSGLLNGNHAFSLVAIDEAGNRQAPSTTKRFSVKVVPTVRILAPRNGDLLNRGELTASWEGTHNCGPQATLAFSLRVDEGEWRDYSPETTTAVSGLEDGDHALFLRAKDALENVSTGEASVRFEVDSTPPKCVAEELPRTWEEIAKTTDFDQDPSYEIQFSVTGTDNRTSGQDLQFRYWVDQNPPSDWRPITEITTVKDLSDGIHQIAFEARDEAENIQPEPTILKFSFNTPPNTRVWADDTGQVITYRFAGKDSNSRPKDISFRWKVDEGPWSDWTDTPFITAAELMKNAEHGEHVLYVESRDPAGNLDATPGEAVINVDKQPPPPPERVTAVTQDEGGEIQMSWDAVPEANATYRVYRSESPKWTKEAFVVETDTPKTRAVDHPKREATSATYYYFTSAVDRAGNESEPRVSEPVKVLGIQEINEKTFGDYKSQVEAQFRGQQYARVIELARAFPLADDPQWQHYPKFWEVTAKAKKILADGKRDAAALEGVRNELDSFAAQHRGFPQLGEVKEVFEEVKSALLWMRLKTFGLYGVILIIVLFLLSLVYRWVQARRIPEMPKIYAETATEGITPSKEALKDPTVLRRWAEVQQEPTSAENWSRLAFAFHNIGEVENAVQSLYKALEFDPNNARFHFQMGHFQKEANRSKEAVRHFERYLQLNPESKKSVEEVRELLTKLKQEEEKK